MSEDRLANSLLPNGLRDALAPDASGEASVLDRLLGCFGSFGYDRVDPPLVEFEENLLTGVGAAMAPQTFRLMDPVSQRMMGVRADITPQVARIAATRLVKAPRPLRLAYGGSVLRVRGTQLRPERQFRQAGCELFGVDGARADAEVISVALTALQKIGVANLSVDICMPRLVEAAMPAGEALSDGLRSALDQKDVAAVAAHGGAQAEMLTALVDAAGPAGQAVEKLLEIDLPEAAKPILARLREVTALLGDAVPNGTLTVDPVERRGFEYQDGICFTLFAKGVRGELGRGGRYNRSGLGEPGTGFTLYLDTLMRAVPSASQNKRIYLPLGVSQGDADQLRAEGWVTITGLDDVENPRAEAERLNCSAIWEAGQVQEF